MTLLEEFLQKNKKLKNPPQETPVGTTGLLLVYMYIYAVPNDTVNIQYAYLLASQQNNPYPIKFEGRFSQKPQLSEP